ncbi:MAG: hypothetical protein ACR2KK_08180 [Acidimicrobiales bacterium]
MAEGTVADDGSYTAVLPDEGYDGGPLDVDLYCDAVPGLKPRRKPAPPVQLHVTTLQPQWREVERDRIAPFDYCVPSRIWCQVRARFGAWVVCGQVTVCSSGDTVSGVTVKAFDADWIQEDALGSGVTDSSGHFRIDYTEEDFTKTPFWFSLELVSGPDLYFRVETPGGSPLLTEDQSKGRTPGRENVGHCACVDLCLDGDVIVPPIPDIPMFTNVGIYRIGPVDSHFTATGTTTVGDMAFTGDVPLIGIMPSVWSPEAIEYRFLVSPPAGPGNEVTAARMAPTEIGKLEFHRYDAVAATWKSDSVAFYANNAGATVAIPQNGGADLVVDVNTPVGVDGWIKVPRINNPLPGGPGRFIPSGVLASLRTTAYTNEAFDLTPAPPLGAGDSVPNAQRSAAPTFSISFEARRVVDQVAVGANHLPVIAFSNMTDTYVRHPYWGTPTDPVTSLPVPVTTPGVASLGIGELVAGGCAEIGDEIHVLFTTYHPYAGTTRVWFDGNPILPPDIFPAVVGGQSVSPAGGQVVDTSLLAKCAYILWLQMDLRLTAGYGSLGEHVQDHIAFCTS